MSQNGKGDKQRPRQISHKEWSKNYDRVFKKDKEDEMEQGINMNDQVEKNYLDRLTLHPHTRRWKLIHSSDEWHPSWSDNRVLILLKQTLLTVNKPKRSQTFYIYACGMDDDEMEIRNISWSEAKRIFDDIGNSTSKKKLRALGLHNG